LQVRMPGMIWGIQMGTLNAETPNPGNDA
jgi:hypothetical protein